MRFIINVEVFPRLQLRIEIQVICIGQQLIQLCLVRSVGTFDFAVQLGLLWFDAHMLHSLIFDMQVKKGLKLMTLVGSDRTDPQGILFDNVVHELDRTSLVMFRKDR